MPEDLMLPSWKLQMGYGHGGIFTPFRPWPDERCESVYDLHRRLESEWRDADRAERNAAEWRRWLAEVRPGHLPPAPKLDRNEVLARLDFMALLERYGLRPRKMGSKAVALCPLHNDKRPSLSVDLDRKLWFCNSSCGIGGSAFDLIMRVESCGFREALMIADKGWHI